MVGARWWLAEPGNRRRWHAARLRLVLAGEIEQAIGTARFARALGVLLESGGERLFYLADLIGVGIVRLTDDLRVEVANTAAHAFLERRPGEMPGRTAMEALGDHRIEALAREAFALAAAKLPFKTAPVHRMLG